ncbi:MAG: hypothetical protein J5974_06465 [Pyramidobacter sp.]|nr:hypothetical protein [Pyramidobacter sp.]
MANVSANVVSVYLSPNKPLRAAVAVDDTIVIKATLADETGVPIDLTGCDVVVTATDREKTVLYTGDILSAENGAIQTIVQPDQPGQYKITAKVSVPLMDDEYTFFLGAFSVAATGDGEPAPTIRSLTETILAAIDAAQAVADDVSGDAAAAAQAKLDAQAAASSAEDYKDAASGYATASEGFKDDASGYARDASVYSSAASGYADDALGYKNNASMSATNAYNSEVAAAESAAAAAAAATAAVNALFTGALAGQVLVKTANGYKWDYPSEAGIVSGVW